MLTPGEVDEFFGVVRSLVDQGKSIIFITHKLREVLAVADRITVLRGGRVVGTADPDHGHPAEPGQPDGGSRRRVRSREGRRLGPATSWPASRGLRVRDDRGATTVSDFDLEVRGGEIFGIAGVEGNGQRELVEAITGMRPKVGRPVRDRRRRRHPA